MPQIRLFHCDDSTAFTRLVAHWLDEHGDIEHVGAAHTGDDAIAAIGPSQPDVVLLDTMGSPGDTALLRGSGPRPPKRGSSSTAATSLSSTRARSAWRPTRTSRRATTSDALVAMIRAVAAVAAAA